MSGSVPRQAFKAQRHSHQILEALVAIDG